LSIDAVFWDATVLPHTIQAISLSHKKIVKYAKDNKLPEICIAEDDILFTSLNSYKYFLDNKPDDFDIYLGGYYTGIPLPDKTLYSFSGLHIYCIRESFYEKFLSVTTLRNIDQAIAGMGLFKFCEPLVAKQRNGYSFHRKKIVDDDHFLEDRKFLED
jgi:hypothetical protein